MDVYRLHDDRQMLPKLPLSRLYFIEETVQPACGLSPETICACYTATGAHVKKQDHEHYFYYYYQ